MDNVLHGLQSNRLSLGPLNSGPAFSSLPPNLFGPFNYRPAFSVASLVVVFFARGSADTGTECVQAC